VHRTNYGWKRKKKKEEEQSHDKRTQDIGGQAGGSVVERRRPLTERHVHVLLMMVINLRIIHVSFGLELQE